MSATDIAPVDHEEGMYWSRQPPIEWMLLDSGATHQVTYLPNSLIPKGAKPVKVSLAVGSSQCKIFKSIVYAPRIEVTPNAVGAYSR